MDVLIALLSFAAGFVFCAWRLRKTCDHEVFGSRTIATLMMAAKGTDGPPPKDPP